MTPEERFWSHVDKRGEHWRWTGATMNTGYGTVRWNGRMEGAHRVAYMLSGRELLRGDIVRQRCKIKKCCRPECLYVGRKLSGSGSVGRARSCQDRGPEFEPLLPDPA